MKRLLAILALTIGSHAVNAAEPGPSPVTVTGIARDAKGGAAIVGDDGAVIYLDGLDAWPETVSGQRIEAEGVLTEADRIPDAQTGATGDVSAGDAGTQSILLDPLWRVLQ